MKELDYIDWASIILVIVGSVNWGLVGLGHLAVGDGTAYNLVYLLMNNFLGLSEAEYAIYILVGLAGLYQVYFGYNLYEE